MTKRPGNIFGRRWWDVLSQTLATKPSESVRKLSAAHDFERLQLALMGAREAAFDWTLADDRIAWNGGTDVLSLHHAPNRLCEGEVFRAWMSDGGRAKPGALVQEASVHDRSFGFEFEAASALGSEWLELRGVRIS